MRLLLWRDEDTELEKLWDCSRVPHLQHAMRLLLWRTIRMRSLLRRTILSIRGAAEGETERKGGGSEVKYIFSSHFICYVVTRYGQLL